MCTMSRPCSHLLSLGLALLEARWGLCPVSTSIESIMSCVRNPPSRGHRSSPLARLMPALAITISQLLLDELAIAASNSSTCSSQLVISHLTNCALLHAVVRVPIVSEVFDDLRAELLCNSTTTIFAQISDGHICSIYSSASAYSRVLGVSRTLPLRRPGLWFHPFHLRL